MKRKRRIRRGVLGTIRSNASRKSEYQNRLGITWRSRPGTLRERDFRAFDRNLLAARRMGSKIERLVFGKQRKIDNSAFDYVGREV